MHVQTDFKLRQVTKTGRHNPSLNSVSSHSSPLPTMFRSTVSKTILNAARPSASRLALRPVQVRGYHEKVISHYEKPRNVRLFFAKVWTPQVI